VPTSVLSNYAGNAALAHLLGPGKYLACHVADPTVTGLLASEVAGGGYVRQPITMASPSGKTAVSTNAQIFPGMPACVVIGLAVWDAIAAGHMIFFKALVVPGITVTESGQLLAAAGDVAVSL
jgi:hypothetical protein